MKYHEGEGSNGKSDAEIHEN